MQLRSGAPPIAIQGALAHAVQHRNVGDRHAGEETQFDEFGQARFFGGERDPLTLAILERPVETPPGPAR